jgi:hypothetical protein
MTQEEKDLLLKDLCARLPYGVRMKELDPVNGIELELYLTSIYKDNVQVNTKDGGVMATVIDAFKPYLRPMSSMTKEEKLYHFAINEEPIICTDWLNSHHFDYRGLIEKGLALEAPKDMYKNE